MRLTYNQKEVQENKELKNMKVQCKSLKERIADLEKNINSESWCVHFNQSIFNQATASNRER